MESPVTAGPLKRTPFLMGLLKHRRVLSALKFALTESREFALQTTWGRLATCGRLAIGPAVFRIMRRMRINAMHVARSTA